MTTWCFSRSLRYHVAHGGEPEAVIRREYPYRSPERVKALALLGSALRTRMPSRSSALMTLRRTSARRCLRRNMNRVVITGIGCCTSLGWGDRAASRGRLPCGCPAFAPSEASPGYSACPVSDLGDDAAYSRFSGTAAPPLSEPGCGVCRLVRPPGGGFGGIRSAHASTDLPDRGIRPHAGFRSGKRASSSGF